MSGSGKTNATERVRLLARDSDYHRRTAVYSALIVIASLFAFGSPVLTLFDASGVVAVVFLIVAAVLFLYATFWFGAYLQLTTIQWVIAVGLLPLAWVGSALYMITRVPNWLYMEAD